MGTEKCQQNSKGITLENCHYIYTSIFFESRLLVRVGGSFFVPLLLGLGGKDVGQEDGGSIIMQTI